MVCSVQHLCLFSCGLKVVMQMQFSRCMTQVEMHEISIDRFFFSEHEKNLQFCLPAASGQQSSMSSEHVP